MQEDDQRPEMNERRLTKLKETNHRLFAQPSGESGQETRKRAGGKTIFHGAPRSQRSRINDPGYRS